MAEKETISQWEPVENVTRGALVREMAAHVGAMGDATSQAAHLLPALEAISALVTDLAENDTIAVENTKVRRALAKFVNAYSFGARAGVSEARREIYLFRAFLTACAALGIKPPRDMPTPPEGDD